MHEVELFAEECKEAEAEAAATAAKGSEAAAEAQVEEEAVEAAEKVEEVGEAALPLSDNREVAAVKDELAGGDPTPAEEAPPVVERGAAAAGAFNSAGDSAGDSAATGLSAVVDAVAAPPTNEEVYERVEGRAVQHGGDVTAAHHSPGMELDTPAQCSLAAADAPGRMES